MIAIEFVARFMPRERFLQGCGMNLLERIKVFGKSCGGREYVYSHTPEIPREPRFNRGVSHIFPLQLGGKNQWEYRAIRANLTWLSLKIDRQARQPESSQRKDNGAA
jgi:hypothetical protein